MSRPRGAATPLTEQAHDIDRIWNVVLIIACGVAAMVLVLVVYVVLRYRRRSDALPRQVKENIPVEVAYTVVPLLVVAGLFAVTFFSVRSIDRVDDDPDLVVQVTGFQWQWKFDYPESGVSVVGNDTELPVLVLPAGERVQFDLTSVDVIHSFWIPGFRFKRDTFPGEVTRFQVDIDDETGTYDNTGVCAEFCGLDHHRMRFSVRIVTPEEFEAWTAEQAATQDGESP